MREARTGRPPGAPVVSFSLGVGYHRASRAVKIGWAVVTVSQHHAVVVVEIHRLVLGRSDGDDMNMAVRWG